MSGIFLENEKHHFIHLLGRYSETRNLKNALGKKICEQQHKNHVKMLQKGKFGYTRIWGSGFCLLKWSR